MEYSEVARLVEEDSSAKIPISAVSPCDKFKLIPKAGDQCCAPDRRVCTSRQLMMI